VDAESVASLATPRADRVIDTPQIYGHKEREAEVSVNFVTYHNGFTLNDLVSYNENHHEANGENNQDGANDNRTWNRGVEGPTDHAFVEKLRKHQMKIFEGTNSDLQSDFVPI
jgi:isoamylase